jgi:hypothetical protein
MKINSPFKEQNANRIKQQSSFPNRLIFDFYFESDFQWRVAWPIFA